MTDSEVPISAPTVPLPEASGFLPVFEGLIRTEMDDFRVEEIPLVEPEGEGEHLWVHIEKRGLDTMEARRHLARCAGVAPRDVGFAGRKDRWAVTRQWFSLPSGADEKLTGEVHDGLTVLDKRLHTRKLRMGWLRGNRFVVRIRELPADATTELPDRVAQLHESGMPNSFGPQRFGMRGDGHEWGRACLRGSAEDIRQLLARPHESEKGNLSEARTAVAEGRFKEARFPPSMALERACVVALKRGIDGPKFIASLPRRSVDLLVSAFQSEGFNRVLEGRRPDGFRARAGDVAQFADGSTLFPIEDPVAEQARLDRHQILVTGPLVGTRGMQPGPLVLALEQELLGEWKLDDQAVRPPSGSRRPLLIPSPEISCTWVPAEEGRVHLDLGFDLPSGAFATSLFAALGLRVLNARHRA